MTPAPPTNCPPANHCTAPLRSWNQWQPVGSQVGGVCVVATPISGRGLSQLEGAGLPATPGAGRPSPPPPHPHPIPTLTVFPSKGWTPPHPCPCPVLTAWLSRSPSHYRPPVPPPPSSPLCPPHPSSSPTLFQSHNHLHPITILLPIPPLPIPSLSPLHPHPISSPTPPAPTPSPLPATPTPHHTPTPLTGAAQPLFTQPDQQRLAHIAVSRAVEVLQAPHVLPIVLHVLRGRGDGGQHSP